MNQAKIYTAIGLMSGTSLDGVDVALIRTDGEDIVELGASMTLPYDDAFRDQLRQVLGPAGRAAPGAEEAERTLTQRHADLVKAFMQREGLAADDIDVIGFHGQTVHHDPKKGVTVQLGDGKLLSDELGIPVVGDFRSRDVNSGGEGAPLVPVFHAALLKSAPAIKLPAVVVNIGGVANVTWVGDVDGDILAFDTGPGNAPLNDWMCDHVGESMDSDGAHAAKGAVDEAVLTKALDHAYFDRKPPKSLDRLDFGAGFVENLGFEDGAATLTAFIARSVARAAEHFAKPANTWIVTGGGRLNPVLMEMLGDAMEEYGGADVRSAEAVGWDGDAVEAQAFAYLAVRSQRWLPITFPMTTGVAEPLSGGTTNHPGT